MKTRYLAGLCSTVISLSLAGCGSSDDGSGSPSTGSGGTTAVGGSSSGGVGGSASGGMAGNASGGVAGSSTGGSGGATGGSGGATGGSGGAAGGAATAIEVLATQKYPATIALDATFAYWNTAELPTDPSLGGLWRLPKQGGTPELLYSGKGMVDFVLDGSELYTMVTTGSALPDDMVAVSVSSKTVKVLASNEDASRVATDSTHLYWIGTNSTNLKRVPKTGGAVEVLSSALSQPRAIAVDGGFVYVSNDFGNELLRVAATGGTPAKVWTAPTDAGQLDLIVPTADSVFWRTGASYTAPALVYELPKGQAQVTAVTGAEKATWLAADASSLYASPATSATSAWLSSRPLSGGSWTPFATLAYAPPVFAVDATHVYFTSYKAGVVARVPK